MAARSGMTELITRLRDLTADRVRLYQETATGDGTTKTFWLSHSPQFSGGTIAVGGVVQGTTAYGWDTTYGRIELTTAPASGTAVAVEYRQAQYTDDELEDVLERHSTFVLDRQITWQSDTVAGGSIEYHRALLGVRDVEGTASGTAYWRITDSTGAAAPTDYTLSPNTGELYFTADTAGTAYYWTGYTYDVWGAAADVWETKAGGLADWYSFASGGERYERQQAYDHCKAQAKECRGRAGQNRQRGAVQSNVFLRRDLAPRRD